MEEAEVKWELYEMFQAFLQVWNDCVYSFFNNDYIHQYHFSFFFQAPIYHLVLEGLLMMWVLWLIFRKSYNPQEKTILTEKVLVL